MKTKQLYQLLLAGLVIMGFGFIAVGYGAEKVLESQSTQLAKLKAQSMSLEDQRSTLTKNKKDIAKYSELNTIAKTIVPQDKDQAEAVREIVKLASDSGISKLSSVTFPASTLGTVTPGQKGAALTQVKPVVGITGVYDLQIVIAQDNNNTIPYSQFITFLQNLEQNRRTAQVSNISVQPDTVNPKLVSFSLTIDEFIKP